MYIEAGVGTPKCGVTVKRVSTCTPKCISRDQTCWGRDAENHPMYTRGHVFYPAGGLPLSEGVGTDGARGITEYNSHRSLSSSSSSTAAFCRSGQCRGRAHAWRTSRLPGRPLTHGYRRRRRRRRDFSTTVVAVEAQVRERSSRAFAPLWTRIFSRLIRIHLLYYIAHYSRLRRISSYSMPDGRGRGWPRRRRPPSRAAATELQLRQWRAGVGGGGAPPPLWPRSSSVSVSLHYYYVWLIAFSFQ